MFNSIFGTSAPKFVYDYGVADKTITTDYVSDANKITCTANLVWDGQRVQFTTTGALPAPLAIATDYFVVNADTNDFEIALTKGGTPIVLTDNGSGTNKVVTAHPVNLDYWTPINDGPDTKEIIVESEIEAYRLFIPRGEFWELSGVINLMKYGSLTNIRSKFEDIYAFNRKLVTLYKHRDGAYYKNENGTAVLFYMTVTPKNLGTLDYRDVLLINFRSTGNIDFSDSSAITIPIEEIVMSADV